MSGETIELGIADLSDAVQVGAGGFGTVFKAHQDSLHRDVAVKMVNSTITDEKVRIRFEREIAAMGMLSGHPNIVTVFDSGYTESGQPYILMDFMDGGSLGDRLERAGQVSWQDALPLMVKVCGALETAHKAGILHRDIKPENVLVNAYDEPKLGDFGIARLKGGPETGTSSLTASIEHVSPELLDAHPPSVSSDVYALGSTMFKLLVGESAFVKRTDESIVPALARIQSQPVPDLRSRGMPDAVAQVVERSMAKDPADRFESARAMGEQIREVQRHLGLPVTPLPVRDKAAKKAKAATQVIHSDDLLPSGGFPDPGASQPLPPSQTSSGPQPLASPPQTPTQQPPMRQPAPPQPTPAYQQYPQPAPPQYPRPQPQTPPQARPQYLQQPPQPQPSKTSSSSWKRVSGIVLVVAVLVGGGVAVFNATRGGGAAAQLEPFSYEEVSDAQGQLRLNVPESWDDRELDPWQISDVEVGPQIVASADVRAFRDTWNQPGVIFGASERLAQEYSVQGLLDELADDFLDSCDLDGTDAYEDPIYEGTRHDYSNCGGIDTSYHIIAATPKDGRDVLLLLQVQAVNDRDDDALAQAVGSFVVDRQYGAS